MNSNLKKLTALSLAAVLALNLAGRNVYADESIIDESLSEESVNDESNGNETPFESDEEQQKSNDENNSLETDGEIGTNDVEDTQDSIENEGVVDEGIVDKQIITGFVDLDDSIFIVEEKLPIEELGLPEQLPVYINGSDEVEYIAVTWECADYENTEYESYTFMPVWDVDSYELALDLDSSAVPVIEVNIQNIMKANISEGNVVTPEEGDFSFKDYDITGLEITGLTDQFLKELLAKGIKYINLDLSNAKYLKEIGDRAFYNFNSIGTLVLPEKMEKIGQRAFKHDKSASSILGELIIPENIKEIGEAAFYNQAGITKLTFKGNKINELPDQVFRYCSGLEGVIKLPSSIQKMGKSLFSGTNIQTIYFPKFINEFSIASTAFNSTEKLKYIICDKNDLDNISTKIGTANSKLTYEIEVNFITNSDVNFEPIIRLYKQPYNLEKQLDGQWNINTNYKFPLISNRAWASHNSSEALIETDYVRDSDLYPITIFEEPVITYGNDINKVYDGQESILKVNASHSKARPHSDDAEPGDVWFQYEWKWDIMIGKPESVLEFDMNEYSVKDVRQTTAIGCTVTVYTYIINDQHQAKIAFTDKHTFTVDLRQAPSIVNPIYSNEQRTIGSGFPDISLSEGDTEGTIKWDNGQTITEGIHDYTWTFTPVENSVGSSNYTTVTGKASLNFVQGYNVIKGNITNGDIELDKPYGAVPNDDLTITFKPNSGYKLSSALLDNTDIFNQVSDNKYTIRNIQSNHTLDASFTSMETKDVEDVIESLPDIKDVVITEEVKNDILDAKLHYDAVTKDSEDISEDAKEKMYEAISKLDQVKTMITPSGNVTNNIDVSNEVSLLENMETEDAEALKNSNTTSLKIELVVDAAIINDADKQQALERVLGDAVVGDSFDVTVIKKLIDNNSVTKETPLKELKKPIQLIFEIPSNLPAIEPGYVREFSIIRLHDVDGQIIPEVLKDEDSYEDSISVSSDKFSTYIIVYKDVKKQDSSQGGGSGSYFKTYTIRFETFGGSSIDSITDVKTGKKINAPTEPKRKGYIFKGWYIDQACTELWDFSKNAVTSNLTLYAGWEKIAEAQTFNLVFDSMGGSFVDEMKGVAAGEIVNVSVTPVKEGYTFKGWYIDKACTIPWNYTVNDNLILYAGWNKNEIERQSYLIVFESNNGDSTLSEYLPAGDKVSMPESPVREGYTFIGWFIDEECTIPWELDTAVNSNVTLYAGWKEIERQIHLVISEETAEKKSENIKVIEGKKAEMPQEPVKEGYIFKGWFTDKECTIPWDFNTNVVDEDMTLYAGWEKVEEKKEANEQPEKEPTVSNKTDNTTVLTVSALAAVTALIACVFVFKRKKANK